MRGFVEGVALLLVLAGAAAAAPLAGGLLVMWPRPSTLLVSLAFGFASGVLLGAVAFELIPQAIELGETSYVVGAFLVGFLGVYAFDLAINRGQVAGERAQQRARVSRYHQRRRPLGTMATVFAAGTVAKDAVQGLTLGVAVAVEPALAILLGFGVIVDNVAEGLSVGELIRLETSGDASRRRVLRWTAAFGLALAVSALAGWTLLRGLPEPMLGALFAVGGGAVFYLTITELVPAGQERQYEQSSAVATGIAFVLVLALVELVL